MVINRTALKGEREVISSLHRFILGLLGAQYRFITIKAQKVRTTRQTPRTIGEIHTLDTWYFSLSF
jgi:hypothetical protein